MDLVLKQILRSSLVLFSLVVIVVPHSFVMTTANVKTRVAGETTSPSDITRLLSYRPSALGDSSARTRVRAVSTCNQLVLLANSIETVGSDTPYLSQQIYELVFKMNAKPLPTSRLSLELLRRTLTEAFV